MRFVDKQHLHEVFAGKSVAIVGSGPGVLDNDPGFVDSHDVVVRVNNYKTGTEAGFATDVFYSFFGTSIKKTVADLKRDGVTLCMAKCPNDQFIASDWHRRHGKMIGVDFRRIYAARRGWWFCDTYVPEVGDFMLHFNLLGRHVPTTGFAAILDIMAMRPASIYLTGFDFFESKIHNVNEPWKLRNIDDPIGHVPERERAWLKANADGLFAFDKRLSRLMGRADAAAVTGDSKRVRTMGQQKQDFVFDYRGKTYPQYLREGNACRFVAPIAKQFCHGVGLDVGAGKWPLEGAKPVELRDGGDAMELPNGQFDYVFSSHCLEHLANPIAALEHWKSRIRPGGVLFLYLPHPDMEYWRPQNCRKHLHSWAPSDMAAIVRDLGFVNVIHSERDLAWGFSVVGFNG